MALVHSSVLLQALSSFTGVAVKAYTDLEKPKGDELTSFLLQASTPLEILNTGSCKELFVNMDKFFDRKFDYDCTNIKDDTAFTRGNEPYIRPYGWKRIALKVLDKYPNGNAWLGTDGWRSHSVDGEWPVSYHGTSMIGAKSIIESNYEAGLRELYGRGIYSTNDINVAERYSKIFTCEKTGKRYKVLLQNRINPKMRKVCRKSQDYWLIEIPHGTNHENEKAIVENAIRPYGMLLKEV